jgi:diguanylate cyclase (GGDEF)-like protein
VIELDPTTIILMSSLTGAAMSVVLFAAHRSFPLEIKGLNYWGWGVLIMVAASVVYGLHFRDVISSPVLYPLASALLLAGLAMALIATQKFYEQRAAWWLYHAIWIIGSLGMLVWPDFISGMAIFSICGLIVYTTQLRLVWRHGDHHFSTKFLGGLLLVQALVVLTRGMVAALSFFDVALLPRSTFLSVYLAVANFMSLLLTVAFMTVATRRLQTILELRSTLDPLTQVLNRRGFSDIYAKERSAMQREGGTLTVLSIDLDYFKLINDRYGHAVGDQVLMDVASVIAKTLRASDHLARFGGEEFVVLLPATELEWGYVIAERIQATLQAPRVAMASALPPYTVSIGISCQFSADEDLDDIMLRADQALYSAKEHGRNRIEAVLLPETGNLACIRRPSFTVA